MDWNPALYDDKHAFVTALGADLIGLLSTQSGERILDIGCGTGHLTAKIAVAGAAVTGLDSSVEMIAAANAAHPYLEFIVADASDFSFDHPFDAIFSNAALHWVHRAEAAVVCMARALKPGGRFVAEFGGHGNLRQILDALEATVLELTGQRITATNYFPSISEYSTLLERHGLEVRLAHLFDRPTRLEDGEDGLVNWLRMFRRPVMDSLDESVRSVVIQRMKERLREPLFRGGAWHADYRRLRIVARKIHHRVTEGTENTK